MKKIVCFGEMLWDILPEGKKPGGAPMNVAIHWKNTGNQAQLISRIGDDALGQELLDFLSSLDMSVDMIQQDKLQPTGTVLVDTTDRSNVRYEICQPVAWDFITVSESNVQAVQSADFFVFGSLVARSPQSKRALMELLDVARCRVFDCNLRYPFYNQEVIEELLHRSEIVKINDHEIDQLAEWFDFQGSHEEIARQLATRFSIAHVCLTLGADGSAVLSNNQWITCPGYVVEVMDTIGSGDAFLATFLEGIASERPLFEVLRRANAIGALVASKSGAIPALSNQEIQFLLNTPLAQSKDGIPSF